MCIRDSTHTHTHCAHAVHVFCVTITNNSLTTKDAQMVWSWIYFSQAYVAEFSEFVPLKEKQKTKDFFCVQCNSEMFRNATLNVIWTLSDIWKNNKSWTKNWCQNICDHKWLGEMELWVGSNIIIHFLYVLLFLIWHMYLYIIHC